MREVPEWIGKTDDAAVPARVQVRVFQKFGGICPKCNRKLSQINSWQCDHIIALVNGGQNRESNLQPLCTSPCHSQKTKADVAEKAVTARVRAKHLGIKKPRTITRWRRFDGSIREAGRDR